MNSTFETIFGDEDVELRDCRVPPQIIKREYNARWKGTVMDMEYDMFQKVIYRILLNPKAELQSIILQFINKHFTQYKHVVGIQMRMGGCLADFKEGREMMSLENLLNLPEYVDTTLSKLSIEANSTLIYVSTDSTYAENYIRQKMGDRYQVLSFDVFKRSHTHFDRSGDVMNRSLADVFLLAECDVLIHTAGSGFGTLAFQLSKATHKYMYGVTRRDLPVINNVVQCDEEIINLALNGH